MPIGEVYRQQGDLAGGIVWLQKAGETAPNNRKVLTMPAGEYDLSGQQVKPPNCIGEPAESMKIMPLL
jgi:hypothetical protein